MIHPSADVIDVDESDVHVRPSLAAYLVFSLPIVGVAAVFAVAHTTRGYPVWPMLSGFALLVLLVLLVVWVNSIDLRREELSFRGILGRRSFPVSTVRVRIVFRSRSDFDKGGYTKVVGFYLEIHPREHERVLFAKNIKVFNRRQILRFLHAIRNLRVPIQIDRASAYFLGSSRGEDMFEEP